MARQRKGKTLSAQYVSPELYELAQSFMRENPRFKQNNADLVRISVESYIALAGKFGIDSKWHPQIPGVQTDIYKEAYVRMEAMRKTQQDEIDRTQEKLDEGEHL
jgi:hypothetical protein